MFYSTRESYRTSSLVSSPSPTPQAAEDLEYSDLLDAAATLPKGSLERLLAVTAFAVAPYGSTEGRTCKPFNPLLGETYELVHPEKGESAALFSDFPAFIS